MRLIDPDAIAVCTLWQEARGEKEQRARVAIAEVIVNRTKMRYRSDGTIVSTCLWPLQFSGWNAKDPNRIPSLKIDDKDPAVKACVDAWHTALAGGSDLTHGATDYVNLSIVVPDWYDPAKVVAIVESHTFLKMR